MSTVNLTTVAVHAVQFISSTDSGETLSNQQLLDAQSAANNLLLNWFQEQNLAMQQLVVEQQFQIQALLDQLTGQGKSFAIAYTLVAGSYNAPFLSGPSFTPATAPQFPDLVTPITIPNGYQRALETSLGIELAPQYDVPVTPALVGIAREARAAINPMPAHRPVPGQSAASEAPVTAGA